MTGVGPTVGCTARRRRRAVVRRRDRVGADHPGVWLPFRVDDFVDAVPRRVWSWRVAGVPATEHSVIMKAPPPPGRDERALVGDRLSRVVAIALRNIRRRAGPGWGLLRSAPQASVSLGPATSLTRRSCCAAGRGGRPGSPPVSCRSSRSGEQRPAGVELAGRRRTGRRRARAPSPAGPRRSARPRAPAPPRRCAPRPRAAAPTRAPWERPHSPTGPGCSARTAGTSSSDRTTATAYPRSVRLAARATTPGEVWS